MAAFMRLVWAALYAAVVSLHSAALRDELKHLSKRSRDLLERALVPMFAALPKNEHGRLEAATARYAVHRTFVRLHSWLIFGLAPELGNVTSTPSPSAAYADQRPAEIEGLFRKYLDAPGGVGLGETINFAVELEKMIHTLSLRLLESAWAARGLPPAPRGTVDINGIYDVLDEAALIALLQEHAQDPHYRENVAKIYPDWKNTQTFMHSVARSRLRAGQELYTFADARQVILELSERHGEYQSTTCTQLKETLIAKERSCPGRVDLPSFYADTIARKSRSFIENPRYLQVLGALDHSNPKGASVIIPNYIASPANFVFTTPLYTVVCPDECEAMLSQLEMQLQAPDALPAEIEPLIVAMPSASQPNGPGPLPSLLSQRLADIASLHGGRVPLHGRLFAQFMNNVFPRECQFPHPAGTTEQLMPAAFDKRTGTRYYASIEEMKEVSALMGAEDGAVVEQLDDSSDAGRCFPWLPQEELVAESLGPRPWRAPSASVLAPALCAVVLVGLLALFAARGAWTRLSRSGAMTDALIETAQQPTPQAKHYVRSGPPRGDGSPAASASDRAEPILS
eukprot:TRINITY_DN72489_c0_g1_i1.p1 TRINITY_DN72489_c0_g1~~TRINITY_DN72489_c0_g1_i1.p1  ORF type:complete len:586 (-),score=121.86 TRINITY_DN72489_c0_g1_i1:182-1891(-)